MIDDELLDDAAATVAWLHTFDDTALALVAAHARAVVERLIAEVRNNT